jgi:hypothetical protein
MASMKCGLHQIPKRKTPDLGEEMPVRPKEKHHGQADETSQTTWTGSERWCSHRQARSDILFENQVPQATWAKEDLLQIKREKQTGTEADNHTKFWSISGRTSRFYITRLLRHAANHKICPLVIMKTFFCLCIG